MSFEQYLKDKKDIIDNHIEYIFSAISENFPQELSESMRYSLFAGGKRLRPILVYAVTEAFNGNINNAINIGVAIEFIHTYSLIHDDLPAMDNDDFRRGKLTNHKVFGEAMAILAGDALLTEAFNILTDKKLYNNINVDTLLDITNYIAKAAGPGGMVGGQVYDMLYEDKKITAEDVKKIHTHKTAKLITASIYSGARLCTDDNQQLQRLIRFGEKIGLSFQIIDDILDIVGDFEKLGKTIGKDNQQKKATFPLVYGVEKSFEIARLLIEDAVIEIDFLGAKGDILKQMAQFILKRVN